MVMGSYLSIISLNVNGLNSPTKRQRLAKWIQTQNTYICCLQETYLKPRDTYRQSEGPEKDVSCKQRPKESRSSNTYIDKVTLK